MLFLFRVFGDYFTWYGRTKIPDSTPIIPTSTGLHCSVLLKGTSARPLVVMRSHRYPPHVNKTEWQLGPMNISLTILWLLSVLWSMCLGALSRYDGNMRTIYCGKALLSHTVCDPLPSPQHLALLYLVFPVRKKKLKTKLKVFSSSWILRLKSFLRANQEEICFD